MTKEDMGASADADRAGRATPGAASRLRHSATIPSAAIRKTMRFLRARQAHLGVEIPRIESDLTDARETVGALTLALAIVEDAQAREANQ